MHRFVIPALVLKTLLHEVGDTISISKNQRQLMGMLYSVRRAVIGNAPQRCARRQLRLWLPEVIEEMEASSEYRRSGSWASPRIASQLNSAKPTTAALLVPTAWFQ